MAYTQKQNPFKKRGCGRRSPMMIQGKDESLSPKEQAAKAQGREVGEMNKSSRFHPDNVGRGPKTAVKMNSPVKKISGPCKTAAKRKFKVWPSAYASGWGVRCTKAGGPGKMGKSKK
jgi:hypothetical protein